MSWYLLKARNWFSTKAPTDLFIWLNLHACLNVPKRSNFLYMTLFQRYFWFICLCALRRHDDPAYEKRHSFRGGHSVLYSRDSPGYWLHSPTGLHSPGYQTRQPTAWLTGKTHLHAIIYIYTASCKRNTITMVSALPRCVFFFFVSGWILLNHTPKLLYTAES